MRFASAPRYRAAPVSKRRANLILGENVFAADVLDAHPAGTASDDSCGHPWAANHGLAVTDGRVNDHAGGGITSQDFHDE